MVEDILKILRCISEIVAESNELDTVMSRVVSILAESLDSEVCSIYIYDDQNDELVLAASEGLNVEAIGQVRMKPGKGLTGKSFEDHRIVNLANPQSHPDFQYFSHTGEERYRSILCMPLTSGGKCVGVLNLQRQADTTFSPAIIDLVKSAGTQLANLILSSRMLKALADRDVRKEDETSQLMLRGISANPGIVTGKCVFFERYDYFADIEKEISANSNREILLLNHALKLAKKETVELEQKAVSMISEADASIFDVHLMMLEDGAIINALKKNILENSYSIEYSVKLLNRDYKLRFDQLEDQTFREKAVDLKDVLLRLLKMVKVIRGLESSASDELSLSDISEDQILFARELLPSDLIRIPLDSIRGIVCEKGGLTAHVAILAKALDLPALMGVKTLFSEINEGDKVILDGYAETLYIRPGEQVESHFREMISVNESLEVENDPDPSVTKDGTLISVKGNITLISELELLSRYGAEGIGLYRTEFLYMIRDSLPTEDSQYKVYEKIIKGTQDKEVAIRVLDIGADKPLPYIDHPEEDNPVLGWRGIRFLLSEREVFKTHLKAILRAGLSGNLKILFPMISTTSEIVEVKQLLAEVETELHHDNIEHTENYSLGIMLEVPSAVFALEHLLEYVDFMSIGSNDLLQYTFAIDRGNELTSDAFHELHPEFLRMIHFIGCTFRKHPEKQLAICGEMAGNPLAVPYLVGAGIHELSMAPKLIPAVKKIVRAIDSNECRTLLNESLHFKTPEAATALVRQYLSDKGVEL